MKENIYRNTNCGELRITDVGKQVRMAGWVNSIRKLGGITFVTLRDHYGLTQLTVDEEKIVGIGKETVISVSGTVIERSSKNPHMPTGDIEVVVSEIKVLGECTQALPFEIADVTAPEDARLKYRYLNLRNPHMHDIIVKRSKILNFVRNKMNDLGFVEVQTPILTSSSPEGARDYIVPTINAPGKFFALPQAPQQFKQLLMVSGFDKYFQIAPCFRNEAARADRTPGEFYQIDFEMSFATQEDVFAVAEELATGIYGNFTDMKVCKAPFVRLTWKEAREKYASDKPDLRNPLTVTTLTDIFKNTNFSVYQGKTIKAIVAPCEGQSRKFFDEMTKFILDLEGKGLTWFKFADGALSGSALKFLSEDEIAKMTARLNPKNGDGVFIVADTEPRAVKLIGALRNELGERLNLIDKNRVEFCWIVDFPFFERNEETGALEFAHNPFSMPQGGMDALINQNPDDVVAYQYDCVCNGYEMLSGAVRNHDPKVMVKAFEMAGYDEETVKLKFGALYNAFQFGAPPHAGAAFGFDRMLMPIMDTDCIRDVIAFPFTKTGKDLLMNSPTEIDEKTLRELGIKTIKDNK